MSNDNTSFYTAGHRKSTARKKSEADDTQTMHIRFDYSDAYLQNEDLTYQLEDHEDALHKENYKASIDREERLKKVKQDAEERLSLKNAIKNRDPNESSKRISKSANFRRKDSHKPLITIEESSVSATSGDHDKPRLERSVSNTNYGSRNSMDEIDSNTTKSFVHENDTVTRPKPLTNLTMFLISLQKFKHRERNKSDDHLERQTSSDGHAGYKTTSGDKSGKRRTKSVSIAAPVKASYARPATAHELKYRASVDVHDAQGTDDKSVQFGIHVKTDFTRSRRKLEEISRLEQDAKFGYVNKYEERRKRLLASCKDTKTIDTRIQHFLKDVDEFKKLSNNDNSLEKVLMRARSARISRSNTFW